MSILACLADRPATTALVVVLALATAAVALPAAAADPAQRIEVSAARPAAEAGLARGNHLRFDMDDGRKMFVASHGEMLAVRYGGRPERYLHRDGTGRFVSDNGEWSLRIDGGPEGTPMLATLTRPVR
jgi:hypothetical protein